MSAPAWTQRMSPRRWRDLVLLVILVIVVNLPLVTVLYGHHRLATSGVQVQAEVTGVNHAGNRYGLTFRFDETTDPSRTQWPAEVGLATYVLAVRTHAVPVEVVPGHPSEHRVQGEVRGRGAVVFTVIADLVILVLTVLVWRLRVLKRREVTQSSP